MKKVILTFSLFMGLMLGCKNLDQTEDKQQIENAVKTLTEAWSNGDAEKFASPFAEDADFTVWFGLKLSGKKEIAFGHNIIFKEFYANTRWDLKIDKIRFVDQDVALVYCSGAILKEGMESATEPDAVPLLIFNKKDNNWKIIALQNTPYAVNEFRANGDLKRMKRIIREYKD
ncbi:MAG: SgcJ/EcaC family oxidoreductase [Ferruginibacter sp.]